MHLQRHSHQRHSSQRSSHRRFSHRRRAALSLLLAGILAAGCGSGGDPTTSGTPAPGPSEPASSPGSADALIDPGDGGDYRPVLDPADFVDEIDNPYLPFPDGATWRYLGESDGEEEIVEITVTGERKQILGINATVVRDTVTIGGELVEDTYDWFAQDAEGNVWYLGEDVKDYENGEVVSTAGSWEAGLDGAQPGIVMPGQPAEGKPYRQEYLVGEAEDMMEIVEIGSTLTIAGRTYDDVVRTQDWSPLEPDVVEEKAYARGVGKISERKTAGGDGFAELESSTLLP
jgi:hypothetical protein